MTVPTFESMLRPILALSVDAPITRSSATEAMVKHFDLSEEDQLARIPSGGSTVVRSRAGWAMTFLTKAGLIEKVAYKEYRATERDRQFVETHPDSITARDLSALDGWEQAWRPKESSDDGAEDEEPDTPAAVEARIDGKIRRAIPDPTTRDSVLEFLAYALENADEERSDTWRLRETRRGLELKTGRMLAFRVDPGAIGVSVVGPIADDVRLALGASQEAEEDWKKVVGGLFFTLPAEKAASALDLLREPFAKFVDAAIARVRRDVDMDDHVPEAIAYLSKAVGRELPQPEARPARIVDEGDETSEDDESEVTREPRARGRAPIFEHGQRAIASLIEDIDPERGTIALPDLQRPFVWEDIKVRDLLDSLFIGFPVGTLVLWHTSEEKDARALGAARRGLRATTLVIDGQQRLTSLYSVMRGKEVEDRDGSTRLITIAFRPRDGKFEVADAAIRKDPEFIPNVTELWNGPRTKFQIRRDLLKTLQEKGRVIGDAYAEAVDQNLERAQAIKDYRFPTVDIRKTAAAAEATEEDVADIFVRINNQGTRLGQAEFVLTLLSVFHGELRDRIETRARQMSENAVLSVDTQQVLRMACAVGLGRARMSAVYRYLRGIDPIAGDADPARRVERLDTLDRAAAECVEPTRWRDFMLRVTHAGFVSHGLVASANAVVNAYAFYILGCRTEVPKQRLDEGISRWLFGTLLTARYSGSSETKFEEDLPRGYAILRPETPTRSCTRWTTSLVTLSLATTGIGHSRPHWQLSEVALQ